MFGMGTGELLLILLVALLVFGPKKLPDLAKGLGKAIREFRRASTDLQEQLAVDRDIGPAVREVQAAASGLPSPAELEASRRPPAEGTAAEATSTKVAGGSFPVPPPDEGGPRGEGGGGDGGDVPDREEGAPRGDGAPPVSGGSGDPRGGGSSPAGGGMRGLAG